MDNNQVKIILATRIQDQVEKYREMIRGDEMSMNDLMDTIGQLALGNYDQQADDWDALEDWFEQAVRRAIRDAQK